MLRITFCLLMRKHWNNITIRHFHYPPLRLSAIKIIGTDCRDSVVLDSPPRSIIHHSRLCANICLVPVVVDNQGLALPHFNQVWWWINDLCIISFPARSLLKFGQSLKARGHHDVSLPLYRSALETMHLYFDSCPQQQVRLYSLSSVLHSSGSDILLNVTALIFS